MGWGCGLDHWGLVAAIALILGWQANRLAKEANKEARLERDNREKWEEKQAKAAERRERDRETWQRDQATAQDKQRQEWEAWQREQAEISRRNEVDRHETEVAGYLSASWAVLKSKDGGTDRWGILLECKVPVYDVSIRLSGNDRAREHDCDSVVSGQYFVESNPRGRSGNRAWGDQERVAEDMNVKQVNRSRGSHKIESTSFRPRRGGQRYTYS